MKELALHILDLAQNSVAAEASLIVIEIDENLENDTLVIRIEDNGRGMEYEEVRRVKDPFVTSRTTRKVGLGIPLMLAACQRCEGDLSIESQKNVGTKLTGTFKHSHIDRAPLGDMSGTMISLIVSTEDVDYVYIHKINHKKFILDTREIRQTLGTEVPLSSPEVLCWIKDYIDEGLSNLCGGV